MLAYALPINLFQNGIHTKYFVTQDDGTPVNGPYGSNVVMPFSALAPYYDMQDYRDFVEASIMNSYNDVDQIIWITDKPETVPSI